MNILAFLLILTLIFTPLSAAAASDAQNLIAKFKAVDWDSRAKESKKKKDDDAWKVRIEIERELVMQGKAAIADLVAALSDENRHVRALAASVLGILGDVGSLPNIQKALETDSDATVRLYAAEAIGRIGRSDAAQPLEAALKDPNENVRNAAQQALGRIKRGRSSNFQAEYAKVKAEFASAVVNQMAPDFSLMSTEGERIQLSFFRGKQPLLLIFTAGDWSEKCNRMLIDLKGLYQNIRSRYAEVLVINPQESEISAEWHKKLELHFPILSDPTGLVGAAYGVGKQIMVKDRWVNLPAEFIIDKKGILRFAHIGKSLDDRTSVVALIRELDKVKK
jgi:peroxiredoxin